MPRSQKTYDHRLRELVRRTSDLTLATALGVPRSTAAGWLRQPDRATVTHDVLSQDAKDLQAEIIRLRRRIQRLRAVMRLLVALLRAFNVDLAQRRLPDGEAKSRLLGAIERAQPALKLRTVLRILGLSVSRFHAWKRAAMECDLDDHSSCPRSSPLQLTLDEIQNIREMVTSPEYRHVPKVRQLVEFYVKEHNERLPHSAFRGQTPNEMYFGRGDDVPGELDAGKKAARQRRVDLNRALSCLVCEPAYEADAA